MIYMKYTFLSFLFFFLCFNSVLAQQVDSSTWTITKKESLDMEKIYKNDINQVSLKFCNDWLDSNKMSSRLNLSFRPNQNKHLCVSLLNRSDIDLSLDFHLYPGKLDEKWHILCSTSQTSLSWVIVNYQSLSGVINLNSKQMVNKYFPMKVSNVASGDYYLCFAVSVSNPEKLSTTSFFNLVVRKSGDITINVSWKKYYFNWLDDIVFWCKRHMNQISLWWIIVFAVLMWYTLFAPTKKKSKIKKHNIKK